MRAGNALSAEAQAFFSRAGSSRDAAGVAAHLLTYVRATALACVPIGAAADFYRALAPFIEYAAPGAAPRGPAGAARLAPRADEAPGFEWDLGHACRALLAVSVTAGRPHATEAAALLARLATALARADVGTRVGGELAARAAAFSPDELAFTVAAAECRWLSIAQTEPGATVAAVRAAHAALGARMAALRPARPEGWQERARACAPGDARAGPLLRRAVRAADAADDRYARCEARYSLAVCLPEGGSGSDFDPAEVRALVAEADALLLELTYYPKAVREAGLHGPRDDAHAILACIPPGLPPGIRLATHVQPRGPPPAGGAREPAALVCAACGQAFAALLRCGRCRDRAYGVCGAACQRADWPAHKRACLPKPAA
jgi:hypothetical protein